MTVHRRTYPTFEGERRPPARLFWVIARRELRLGLRKKWVKRLLVLSGIPVVALMFGLYVELVVEQVLHTRWLGNSIFVSLYEAQIFFVVLMMAAVGADVLAKDVSAGAHHLYFSRPLTPGQYLLGKLVAVAVVLGLLIVVPGLLLALAQFLLATEQDVANLTRLMLGILVYGVVLSAAAAVMIGCLSAYGRRARTVGAIWVGLYFFTSAAAQALSQAWQSPLAELLSIHLVFVDSGRLLVVGQEEGVGALLTLLALAGLALALALWRVRSLQRSES